MISFLKFQPNPFRFLLIAEWVMLASCASLALVEALQDRSLPVQHLLILVLLCLMGLNLPGGKRMVKVLYTSIQIGSIFYGTVLGYLHILPTLYLIVVVRSCFVFEFLWRWAIAGFVFILFLANQVQYGFRALPDLQPERVEFGMHLLTETLMFGLGIFLLLQLTNKLLAERMMRTKLDASHSQLQLYAQKIEEVAVVQERHRIARDIHDSLGQALTSLNIQLQTVVKLWQRDPAGAQRFLEGAQQLAGVAISQLRQSVSALRDHGQKDRPLQEVIEPLVEDFRQGTGMAIHRSISQGVILPEHVTITLYRIVQEALTNICKYAQATSVKIQLTVTTTPDNVCLIVEDNGRGFCLNQKRTGFGLLGMQERVAAHNGRFQIKTEPGSGCKIIVKIPL